MKVLVTGGGGYIGRPALELLAARGAEIHAVTHRQRPDGDESATWHHADLLTPSVARSLAREVGASHLLHLAWCSEPGRYWTSPENLAWVGATLDLLRGFAEGGGRRAVLAGTCAEYELGHGVCSETSTPTTPATLYGTCKHATGIVASAAGTELGVSVARGRIFYLYGPHERPARLAASVITALLEGRRAECTAGTQVRDFLHVRDVADALVHLLEAPVEGPVNVASGVPIEVRAFVGKIASLIGREDLLALGARPQPLDDPAVVVGDPQRLRGTGWEPTLSLDEGLASTISWWESRLASR